MHSRTSLWILLAVIGFTGCWNRPAPPDPTPPSNAIQNASPAPDPHAILKRMVTAYKTANSYSDQATLQIVGKMSQPDTEPALRNCYVTFQKPNKLCLTIYDGSLISNSEDCYARIHQPPFFRQILRIAPPDKWTFETLFRDVHLDAAMKLGGLPDSVFRFPPQLILLFANDPLKTFCPEGAKVEWIEQQPIGHIQCDIIQISHTDGNRFLWIGQEEHILLRLDYQPVGLLVPEGYESIEAIRIEMTDARFDVDFFSEMFRWSPLASGFTEVTEFTSDAPGLPTPEEHRHLLELMAESDCYRFIDKHTEIVTSTIQFSPSAKIEPATFSLSHVWSHPLLGASAMTLLPGETPTLLVPCKGNLVAVLNLQGKVLEEISPKGLGDSIITNIQVSPLPSEKQIIGISTLDHKIYFFDESFEPIADFDVEPEQDKKEEIRDFLFVRHQDEDLLLLGIQVIPAENPAVENPVPQGIIRAVDLQGKTRWEYSFEGIPNQISWAVIENQSCVLVSRTSTQNSILVLSSEGAALDSVEILFGRHVIWHHVLDSTIYTLRENPDTGDVYIVGLDRRGKVQWSRLLATGEFEVDPIYVSKEKKWFVPLPNGEIWVFDLLGNWIDKFSLNVVPAGLFCVEVEGESILFIADSETVSAWKVECKSGAALAPR